MNQRIFVNSIPKAGTHLLLRVLSLLQGYSNIDSPASTKVIDYFKSRVKSYRFLNNHRTVFQKFIWQYRFYREQDYLDIGPYRAIKSWTNYEEWFARKFLRRLNKGQYIQGHVFHFPEFAGLLEDLNITQLIVIRDPRDVCVSTMFHVMKYPEHRLSTLFRNMSQDDRLMATICGLPKTKAIGNFPLLDIGETYRLFLPWISDNKYIVIRFEDLIGPKGGGCSEKQIHVIKILTSKLSPEISDARLHFVAENTFSEKSGTFRKGQIGEWKNYFQKEHIQAIKENAGDVLVNLGYEDDFNW